MTKKYGKILAKNGNFDKMGKLNPDEQNSAFIGQLKKEVETLIIQGKQRKIYKEVVESTEKRLIEIILERTFGNRLKAAKLLGINRNTLHAKIEKYAIDVDCYRGMLD